MPIQLSDHFSVRRLLRFTIPSIGMMIFTSLYGLVDGFFVSNFVGAVPFAAVNFIMPYLMILSTCGFMFGTGGSALVAKTMGEGDHEKANRIFSMLVYISAAVGVVLTVAGYIFLRPVAVLMGGEGEMLEDCITYGRILLPCLPMYIIQLEFQSFFVTAEKPKLGLAVTVASGVTNIILDIVLVGLLPFGLVGAAVATLISQCIGGIVPLVYFGRPNSSLLRLSGMIFDLKALIKTCTNGMSELTSNISLYLVGMLYNLQLMAYAGERGVAAYGVMNYFNTVFLSVFFGYTIGAAPVVGYHFGAQNHGELASLLKKSLGIIGVASVSMFALGQLLAVPLAGMFLSYDPPLMEMTVNGFRIFAFSFLFVGFGFFTPGFFTALNDGVTSAIISTMRTVVAQVLSVLLLPLIFGLDGIFAAIVVAEIVAMTMSGIFLVTKRKKFQYWN